MIWLGLTLGLFGRRAAQVSAAVLVIAVGLGMTASLTSLGYAVAVGTRADRGAWTDLSRAELRGVSSTPLPGVAYVDVTQDYVGRRPVTVVSVAASDGAAPIPPGISHLPAPGEVLVSPALRKEAEHSSALARRYGHRSGDVGEAGLASPSTLLAVRGVSLAEARLSGSAVASFGSSATPVPLQDPSRLLPGLLLVAILALTGVLAVVATKVGGAERRDRLGRLRLLGASARQIRLIALVERIAPIVVGLAAGVAGFRLLRPLAAQVTIGTGSFFPADLDPGPAASMSAVVLVGALGVVSTQAEVRRIVGEPTTSVRGTEPLVRLGPRVVPAAALVALGVLLSSPSLSPWQPARTVTVLGSALAAFGLLMVMGPWLVQAVGRLLRGAGSAVRLLSGRRLESNPRAVFRATAGVAIAIVLVSAYAAVAPGAYADLADRRVIGQRDATAQILVSDATLPQSRRLEAQLAGLPGVRTVAEVTTATTSTPTGSGVIWIGDCAAITQAARLRHVPCHSAPVVVARNRLREGLDPRRPMEIYDFRTVTAVGQNAETLSEAGGTLTLRSPTIAEMPANTAIDSPDLIVSPSAPGLESAGLRPSVLLVDYGPATDLETVRTVALGAAPNVSVATRGTSVDGFNLELRTVRDLVAALSAALFVLAGISILVAVQAAALERRDAFRALLEAGTPRRTLLRDLAAESAVPVLLTGLAAAVVGGGVAWLLAGSDLPVSAVVVEVGGGVVVSTLVSLLVLVPARRLTRPT